ncbi:MAG: DAK2 domain-containing protein [Chloroflexi bacterium CFX4]|nr:DAK2 domain-containing protein [Chloroflexi bacterium CFX4]MDL1922160.1 DAK2 domain-containing protein [Chloroflexi bacterium CFX3]
MISPNLTHPDFSRAVLTCDGALLRHLMAAALFWLEQHVEQVNALNVFPVPDGDTGTNMLLTLRAAYAAAAHETSTEIGVVAAKLAYGALHGSRGNSGTVLSQLLNGIAGALRGKTHLDAALLAQAFAAATQAAYATFPKPVEGTILTVARAISEAVAKAAAQTADLKQLFLDGLASGRDALARTPQLLPILAQAGVVDSGGQGLIVILEGMARLFDDQIGTLPTLIAPTSLNTEALDAAFALSDEYDDDGFGYDVQYILYGENLDVDAIRAAISAMGNSPIVVGTPEAVKVHVHVPDPQVPLAYGESVGTLSDVVVENMEEQSGQYRTARLGNSRSPEIAVISVVYGEGMGQIFRDLGARLLPGGQTMNPSVGEFLDAMRATNAQRVILLPNNPNVILTAQQAAQLAETEIGCLAAIIPTRTLPQGIAAMIAWQADGEFEQVRENMQHFATQVRTVEVTTATRDASLNGVQVQTGQIIGLLEDQIIAAGGEATEVVEAALRHAAADAHEVITLYHGAHITDDEAEALAESVRLRYPDQEVAVLWGGQPYYHYIIGIE